MSGPWYLNTRPRTPSLGASNFRMASVATRSANDLSSPVAKSGSQEGFGASRSRRCSGACPTNRASAIISVYCTSHINPHTEIIRMRRLARRPALVIRYQAPGKPHENKHTRVRLNVIRKGSKMTPRLPNIPQDGSKIALFHFSFVCLLMVPSFYGPRIALRRPSASPI